ncbi:MAG: 2-amino-4-hydroxy-6-hydroxymethyldihydropteridine diphosphokinase [Coriobacteriia bacterium]|nr:2-amino-4-hydroxy-6-hydroxymethyldihydropteridine diphosphokinase [Coriobacteriia bacterium]
MTDAYVGLGSNLGDRLLNLARALEAIEALDETRVVSVSNVVESTPWGVTDQPLFANAVARVATAIPADRFLGLLRELETALGRVTAERNGPRIIDLDLLLYGDDEWQTPELTVPHPRLAERDFAVTPLLEIAPHAEWPDGSPVTRDRATEGRITASLGPVPGFSEVTPPVGGWAGAHGYGDEFGAWEEVAARRFSAGQGTSFALDLLFDAAVLEQEGIPYGWDPLPPQQEYSPWALPRLYRLLVPPPLAPRARELLAAVRAASPSPEDAVRLVNATEGDSDEGDEGGF